MKKLNDFPQWVEANNRLQELRGQLSELENEHQAGLLALRDQERKQDALTAKAEALLNGGQPVVEKVVTQADLETLTEKKRIVRKAIELQEQRIARLRSEFSRQICQEARPEYQKIVRRMAKAAASLQAVAEEERLFRETLMDGDVAFVGHIDPVVLRGFGRKDDPYSMSNICLNEAIAGGYILAKEQEVFQ